MTVALLFSCSKETPLTVPEQGTTVHKVFTVSSGDTKTYLDGMSVKWAADDKINVVAYGTGNQYTFSLTSGANTSSAVFEGDIDEADAAETKFIAVYPDVNVGISKDATDSSKDIIEFLGSASGDHIKYFISETTPVKAIKDGFDSRYAPMTAVSEDGHFVFRHGAAYFKVKVGVDGVKTVKLQASGSARFNGRPKFLLESGINSTVEAAKNNISASPAEGTFEKDGVYYIPALTKQSKIANLTITYTLEDGTTSSSLVTSSLSNVVLTAGKVYNLGCPPISFSPVINVEALDKLEADATNGSFTYTVTNPDGVSTVTAVKKSGDWISDVAASKGTVTFNCTANTGDEREAVITLSYDGAEDVDVTITQKAAGGSGPVVHTYIFYVNDSKEQVQTADGASGSYFTITGSSILDCSSTGYFSVDSFEILGNSYSHAKKIDSKNAFSFTTSNGVTASIRFFAARRQSDKEGTVKLQQGSSNVVSADMTLGTIYDSGIVELEANKSYSFNKSGEIGLFYVVVTETEL